MNQHAGRPTRTSRQQIEQLRQLLAPFAPMWRWLGTPAARAAFRWALLIGWSIFGFGPILLSSVQLKTFNDYAQHAKHSREWLETGHVNAVHFVNSAATLLVHALFPSLLFIESQWVATELAYLATLILVYLILRRLAPAAARRHPAWIALAAISLLLVEPITLFTVFRRNLYFGYIVPANVYHNPTMLMLKPFALLSFWILASLLQRPPSRPMQLLGGAMAAAAWTVLATLTKPNYTICIIPAIALVMAADARLRQSWTVWCTMAAVVVPLLAVLGWQYRVGAQGAERFHILFLPWALVPDPGPLALAKFFLSTAFPLCTAVLFFPQLRTNRGLRLGWLAFAIACLYFYLLVEWPAALAGNFGWGCQITLFLLFVYSLAMLLQAQESQANPARIAACFIVYGLHLACGLLFYALYWNELGDARWM